MTFFSLSQPLQSTQATSKMVDQARGRDNKEGRIMNPPRITLADYVVHQGPRHFSRFGIPPAAKGIHIKLAFLNLVSTHLFSGKDHKDPYAHLDTFYELCATMIFEIVQEKVAYMKLFPFFLIGEAKD